ncbi:hypothetical protein CE91St46_08850 [Eubacteriales bacterium]|nr:hypothetical protein CE91St46_08850 [Eubacteriales bacterium]GKH62410.1 hypothetical protein CE91St47_08790 [Eubacteriales bacterium]
MASKRMLILAPQDNVGVLLEDAHKGDTAVCDGVEVACLDDIEFCHKIALTDIPRQSDFIKYGEIIGYALRDIKKGEWIHIHNLDDIRGREGKL